MPNWVGIEDASATPNRVWLSQDKDTDEWMPLRKVDCKALNASLENPKPVTVDGGRATADPVMGKLYYNFYNRPTQQLTSATWFVVEQKDPHKIVPMSEMDAQAVEELYQQAILAASSLGSGLETVQKQEVILEDQDYRVKISKVDGSYVLRKSLKGWFGKSFDLQRGYGAYVVQGEEDELLLGPVGHVVFVVHGIGEAMWSREEIGIPSWVEQMVQLRLAVHKKLVDEWKQLCQTAQKNKLPEPAPPNAVEFLPIEWYDRLHSSSSAIMKSLKATTLNTIPALRAIANDVIFDVLMYLTPGFCYEVLECVTTQINGTLQLFQKVHPQFSSKGGKCSLVGHSLGAVICWDLLSLLKDCQKDSGTGTLDQCLDFVPDFTMCGVQIAQDGHAPELGYQHYASEEGANVAKNGSWGPSLSKPLDQCLSFVPDFTMFLGSPIGLFLTLRGAHAVFDELRQAGGHKTSPFALPSGSIHNIFHPSDPVAYRIEPLLLSPEIEGVDLPPPLYLTRQGQAVRLHVKAMQLSEDLRKSFVDTKTSLSFFMSKVTEQAQTMLKQIDDAAEKDKAKGEGNDDDDRPLRFPLGGRSHRLDYQLQPRVIDSEYLAAVTAHSSYLGNSDIHDAIIDLTTHHRSDLHTDGAVESPPVATGHAQGD